MEIVLICDGNAYMLSIELLYLKYSNSVVHRTRHRAKNSSVMLYAMNKEIQAYHAAFAKGDKDICRALASEIDKKLPKAESKIWHRHPVWFLDGNPVVGYSKQKAGVRLMFWSGRGFDEPLLIPGSGKFKDASITYTKVSDIVSKDVARWLKKAKDIQWDYKNIVKRKGVLKKLKP